MKTYMYLPQHVYNDAVYLSKKHPQRLFICGCLGSLTKLEQTLFFNTMCTLSQKGRKDFFFYDCISLERNIYFFSHFFYSSWINTKIKLHNTKKINQNFQNYMQNGALFSFLFNHDVYIEKASIRYAGAFAAVHAYIN